MDKINITNIAIGGFDGMHLAHQTLFNYLDLQGAVVVIETGYANLSPKRYRQKWVKLPIFYYPLDEIKHLDGIGFIKLLKNEYPKLNKIVVGYDFHFGTNRKYSTDDLIKLFDGKVLVVDEVYFQDISVHSKVIREFLLKGDIKKANQLLNRPYQISGVHIKGQGLGSSDFVPTINIQCDDFLIPLSGVYATQTIINDKEYKSITFVGHRLTTNNSFAIETHIIDNDISVSNDIIEIIFFKKIRNNQKFNTHQALKKQILTDINLRLSLKS